MCMNATQDARVCRTHLHQCRLKDQSYCHVHFSAFSPNVGNLSQPLQLAPEALKNHLNMEKKKLLPPDHSSVAICAVHVLAENPTASLVHVPHKRFRDVLKTPHFTLSERLTNASTACRVKQKLPGGSNAEQR